MKLEPNKYYREAHPHGTNIYKTTNRTMFLVKKDGIILVTPKKIGSLGRVRSIVEAVAEEGFEELDENALFLEFI